MSVSAYRPTTAAQAVASVQLADPIEEIPGGPRVDVLHLRKVKAGDLRVAFGDRVFTGEEIEFTFDQIVNLLARLSGQPRELIDELSLEDFAAASAALGHVVGKSGGGQASG